MNDLDHAKLLQLAAAYENPREMIMVMEYIGGGELFEKVRITANIVFNECRKHIFSCLITSVKANVITAYCYQPFNVITFQTYL